MMKTLFKTISLFVCIMFAMQSQAQTKEETISWIKNKMEKYGGYNYTEIQITPCEIYETFIGSDGDTYKWINPVVATIYYVIDEENNMIQFKYNDDQKLARGGSVNKDTKTTDSLIRMTNSEENIAERMLKALKHLSTFCERGKNEAF